MTRLLRLTARRAELPPPARSADRAAGRSRRSAAGRAAAASALLLAAVCGGLSTGAGRAAAAPQPMSACTTTSGVVLAVDFSHWGGPLLRSCGTTPTTGYTLLNQGGWTTTGTQHDGPAFICRIGYAGYQGGRQYPAAKDEPCVVTPPTTAYWSYWHADAGKNTWSYSQLGAMSYRPRPGSVDLWTFGATDVAGGRGRPTVSPDTVRARNTAPGPGTSPPLRHGGPSPHKTAGTAPGTPAPTTAPGAPAPATTPPAPATPAPATTAPATTAPATTGTPAGAAATTAAPTSPAAGPTAQDAEPAAAAGHSSGSVLPFAVTAAVLAVIAGLIVLRARQRRRAE
ncbi:hypothetical protein [Actinacidiphila sp. ITFR-21]|uniref:hypothetical protein n=1 Tax=Actinacidiphila sp. ITFR-21 TaxID=3075199 RepID=UPI002889786F|nr:hypothetical protein [Streptomyces sp. ITFR-21]WNI18835.1 hypothetical protein RLT57_27110 [Streptomyces sp. ITFR-21]